jgi:hypothetical protein
MAVRTAFGNLVREMKKKFARAAWPHEFGFCVEFKDFSEAAIIEPYLTLRLRFRAVR